MFRRQQSHLTLPSSFDSSAKLVRPTVTVIVVIVVIVAVVVVIVVVAYPPTYHRTEKVAVHAHVLACGSEITHCPCAAMPARGRVGLAGRTGATSQPDLACSCMQNLDMDAVHILAMHVSYVRAANNGGEMAPKER